MKPYEFLVIEEVELNDDLRKKVIAEPLNIPQIDKSGSKGIPENTYYKFQISPEDDSKIRSNWLLIGSTRLKGHIERLCDDKRTDAENLFGLAIVLTYNNEESILPKLAIEEYRSCSWWYSVSPYILYNLMSQGYPADIAFQAICDWGDTADEWNKPLEGIEKDIEFFGVQQFVLPKNSESIKHKYVNSLAKKVIDTAEAFSKFRNDTSQKS